MCSPMKPKLINCKSPNVEIATNRAVKLSNVLTPEKYLIKVSSIEQSRSKESILPSCKMNPIGLNDVYLPHAPTFLGSGE